MRHLRSILTLAALAGVAACQDTGTGVRGTEPRPADHIGFTTPGQLRTGWIMGPDGNPMQISFEVHDGMAVWEGDIILGPEGSIAKTREELVRKGGPRFGVVTTAGGSRWPGSVVPYVIDPGLPNAWRVTDAMNHIDANTQGVTFVPRTTQADYVRVIWSTGCASYVGRIGGEQLIWLADGCGTGAAVHELSHALGMWHEQSRCDRDAFVEILWQNIQTGQEHNFDTHCEGADVFAYDEGSIMHYGPYAFSANGQPTIRSRRGLDYLMGQQNGLSGTDVATIDWMYPAPPAGHLAYQAHVQDFGWLGEVTDGQVAGTTGQARRMEAMTLRVTDGSGLSIAYQAHVQDYGWLSPVTDGQVAGTTGQARRMEAVSIWLVNPQPGQHVCYQAHVQDYGWLAEVCDGAVAGTTGQSRRMEALIVRLVP